jgi:hypothetical protein
VRFVFGGREVNLRSGERPGSGREVTRYRGGTVLLQKSGSDGVAYIVADRTSFAMRLTSDGFRGFRRDGWFFNKANFAQGADNRIPCLSAFSN